MKINFEDLVKAERVQVPIRDGKFVYNHKKYKIKDRELAGWFLVELEGNKAKVVEQVYDFSELEKKYKSVKGFTYNNSIVFQNFDSAKRKWNFEISNPIHFNSAQSFSAIKAIVWENKEIYFIQPDYTNIKIFDIKTAYDEEDSIEDMKDVTPELRTVFLFHNIERENLREMERQRLEMERLALEAEERRRREEELMRTIPGRLQITFNRAGASLRNYSISNHRITVDWTLHGQHYNSVIDARTFRVLEAGYCMSGEDRKHNITSLVKLAEDYEERGLTHITRR
jgi:hypothetical protein